MRKLLTLLIVLGASLSFGQQTNQDFFPASTGLNIGHQNQRWNGYFQNIKIYGTCTFGNGLPCFQGVGASFVPGLTFNPIPFTSLLTVPSQTDGTIVFVSGVTSSSPCSAGTDELFAERINGIWNCGVLGASPNGVFTTLTITQGLSTTPPALPYIIQGVDPTGTCPYPGAYISSGAVQFCNLGPGSIFSEQINDGGGNFGIFTVRNPVGIPVDGSVPAWSLANQDFELAQAASFPNGIAPPAYTVATLPVTALTNSFAEVTDSSTSGSCTAGGGSFRALCRFNGSTWESMSTQITCSAPFDSTGCAQNIVRYPGTALTGQPLLANNGGQPAFSSPAVLDGNSGNAVTTTPYTFLCDSATTLRDRGRVLRLRSGASVLTVPDSTGSGCSGLYGRITNEAGGTVTLNKSGSDVFNIVDGNTASLAQTSFTIGTGQYLTYYQDTPGVWLFVKSASAGPVVAAAVAITTANVTCGTGGTIDPCTAASTLTGLSYTFPNAVQTWTYTCDIIYSQATNTTNGIGVQTATNGASNLSLTGNLYTAVSTSSTTAIVAVGATTTPQTVNFTPTATVGTKMSMRLSGTIEGTSGSGTTFNVVGFTGSAGDLLTFYRGSKCQFEKQ